MLFMISWNSSYYVYNKSYALFMKFAKIIELTEKKIFFIKIMRIEFFNVLHQKTFIYEVRNIKNIMAQFCYQFEISFFQLAQVKGSGESPI